jgi:hypothetical protein
MIHDQVTITSVMEEMLLPLSNEIVGFCSSVYDVLDLLGFWFTTDIVGSICCPEM